MEAEAKLGAVVAPMAAAVRWVRPAAGGRRGGVIGVGGERRPAVGRTGGGHAEAK